ncbi:hypothetical protein QNA08_11850 [Chelatococcus sp. SYSU_G07232]|uniref:TonB C-terminal domain-containing protein n=1 Tax=Chelatococcus albus TaxID=3047466 RepID=A0ABT7AHT7_9HYPH|nr:hypothetical protein [Chelatococcus sp. SYSU_G07232]MDJ1158929.1 hypothetical protein [Chelatococcus sp. SYSU_G07232]
MPSATSRAAFGGRPPGARAAGAHAVLLLGMILSDGAGSGAAAQEGGAEAEPGSKSAIVRFTEVQDRVRPTRRLFRQSRTIMFSLNADGRVTDTDWRRSSKNQWGP